jgi:NAD(P)-dependent dehydrogenase (short-subunit alcohol dehydrogenase family)
MNTLAGKVSIVTGSTSGIGRGIAEHFSTLGSDVVVHGLDRAEGLETVGASSRPAVARSTSTATSRARRSAAR